MLTLKHMSHELPKAYDPSVIEERWAEYWVREHLFDVATPESAERERKKFTMLLPPPNVTVDSGRKIAGDVAVIGGDVNLSDDAVVGGDLSVVAGNANLAQNAVIHGSRAIMPGTFWLLIPFIPLLLLIGIIWLIVRLFRRNRYRYPVYPPGTSYPPPPPPR